MESLNAAHPELQDALAFAVRHVATLEPGRCSSPVRLVAEQLLEFERRRRASSTTGIDSTAAPRRATQDAVHVAAPHGDHNEVVAADAVSCDVPGGEATDSVEDDELVAKQLASAKRGRRVSVFSEPVRADATFVPPAYEKSEVEDAELRDVLAHHILFGAAPEEARRIIVRAMSRRDFEPGAVVISQGDHGDYYYVVTAGSADVSVAGRGVVLRVVRGGGFGELALLYDAPRAATVTAAEAVRGQFMLTTWRIDRATFKQVLIGTNLRKRELYGSFLRGVPILATLTTAELLTIADALQPVLVPAGAVVVRQGDPAADRFYIVEDGALKAEMEGVLGEVCARLGRGDYFGERALIKDAPRAATVTTVVDSALLAMDRAAFLRLLGPVSSLLARNMDVCARYS